MAHFDPKQAPPNVTNQAQGQHARQGPGAQPQDIPLPDHALKAYRVSFEHWKSGTNLNTTVGTWKNEVPDAAGLPIEIVAGGFVVSGTRHDLIGKPLELLRLLTNAHHQEMFASLIREKLWPADTLNWPDQAVKDTARKLRKALREAFPDIDDPLPSVGEGASLAYRLNLSR